MLFLFACLFVLAGLFCRGTHRAHETDAGSYPGTPPFLCRDLVCRASGYRSTTRGPLSYTADGHPCPDVHAHMSIRGVCVYACVQRLVFINVKLEESDCFLKDKYCPILSINNIIGRAIAW